MEIIGHLGLPRVELDTQTYSHSFQRRSYLLHDRVVRQTDYGKQVLARLNADPKVRALEGGMLSTGTGGFAFSVDQLAIWYVSCVNTFGKDKTERELEAWLDTEEVEVLISLWVLGMDTEVSVDLNDGYAIKKLSDMPDSDEKEHFQTRESWFSSSTNFPKCAITKTVKIKKLFSREADKSAGQNFRKETTRLYDLAFVLNALHGVTCVPHYETSYFSEERPIWHFGGSSGGKPIFDVTTSTSSNLDPASGPVIDSLFSAYEKKNASEKNRLQLILTRLSQSKRRTQLEDRMLDLGIAMEMLLLDDNEKDQLALQFRLRGSWLVGTSAADRQSKWGLFQEIYNVRSSVAHTGILYRNDSKKIARVQEHVSQYFTLAEDCVQKIILHGTPDWRDLVLGSY